MKTWIRNSALGLGALLASAAPVFAQQPAQAKPESPKIPVLYRLTHWEVDDKTVAELAGKVKLSSKELKGRRLQSSELLGVSGSDTLFILGRRDPIVYYDARGSQFQIQYVDSGVKLAVAWSPEKGLEVRPELSHIDKLRRGDGAGDGAVYPEIGVFVSENELSDVQLGDTVVLGVYTGPRVVSAIRTLDPTPKAPNLVTVLELEAP